MNHFFHTITILGIFSIFCISCQKQTETIDEQLTVSTTNLAFTKSAETATVDVTTQESWYVEISEQWIQATPQAGKGSETITIDVEENTGTKSRSSFIKICTPSGFKIVSISQSATDEANTINGEPYGNVTISQGAIQAAFSVSPTKQVYFSMGNLQYRPNTNTWRFAEHQYDAIGENNLNMYESYNDWVDLFFWGTSGYNGTYPYVDYDYEWFKIDGAQVKTIAGTNFDWGVYNPILNGGNKNDQWRTISIDELKYVIKGRENASDKWGVASIDGMNGLVILPDVWTTPAGLTFNPGCADSPNADFYKEKNHYTIEEWKQMESFGAVFLPAAGAASGNDAVGELNFKGRYWTATRWPQFSSAYAQYMYFYAGNLDFYHEFEYARFSVRLVQDVKE